MEAFHSVLGFKQLLMVPSLGSRKTSLMLVTETARFSVVDFFMLLIKKKMDHQHCFNFAIVFDHLGEFKPVTKKNIYITVNSWLIPLNSKLSRKQTRKKSNDV